MTANLIPIPGGRSLTNIAYQQIKQSILDNRLIPGQQLKEEWLASQLHISPTPVREALAKLEQEKLIKIIPHRGKFVAEITVDDVCEIYEVRSVLEGLAVMSATPLIPETALFELEQAFQAAGKQIDQGHYRHYFHSDSQLHHLIIQTITNQWLAQTLRTFNDHVRRIRAFSIAHSGPHIRHSLQEHFAILEAIKGRDPLQARQLMEQHVQQAGERIVAIVKFVTQTGGHDQTSLTTPSAQRNNDP